METINLSDFAKAIERQYPGITSMLAEGYARVWIEKIDPSLFDALQCWIDGKEVPDAEYDGMSIQKIMDIRHNSDVIKAILLLSDYIQDPKRGLARIRWLRR